MGKKYVIDVDNGTCIPYIETKSSLADELAKHRGAKEYEGIVADIQKWYYGYVSKTSWCATGISYFMHKLGRLKEIGEKNENVYNMMEACKAFGDGTFFDKNTLPKKILKDDILFFLWDNIPMMKWDSEKHVTVAEYDSECNTIFCIGCNQKNKICTLEYDRKFLYAVYRPL